MAEVQHLNFVSFSVVVAASNHNPTILNPEFLYSRKIVPKEFEVENTFTTPPLSVVTFKEGVSIEVELNRLQVSEQARGDYSLNSHVPSIATKYVSLLPHVRFSGVGINWAGFVLNEEPANWLKDRFVAGGPWREPTNILLDMGIRFTYSVAEAKCKLSLSDGEAAIAGEQNRPAVLVNVNYHHDILEYPGDKDVIKVIRKWKEYYSHLKTIVHDVIDAGF